MKGRENCKKNVVDSSSGLLSFEACCLSGSLLMGASGNNFQGTNTTGCSFSFIYQLLPP